MIVVDVAGNFSERLRQFNDVIDTVRADILSTRNLTSVDIPLPAPEDATYNELRIVSDSYVHEMNNSAHIRTLVLPWQHAATGAAQLSANLHLQTYYPWTGSRLLCRWLRRRDKQPELYVRVFKRIPCNEDIANAARPTSINYAHLKDNIGLRQQLRFYTEPPTSVIHLHVIAGGGFVDENGHVTAGAGSIRLVLDYCYRRHEAQSLTRSVLLSAPYYDEVFAMKHPPGGAFYHGMVEEMPRIAAFVQFLRLRQQVRIHATRTGRLDEFLTAIGIDPARAVSGIVRAGVIYVPRAATCMMPRVLETQLLAQHYLHHVERNLAADHPARQPARNRLVLIVRSGKRRFANQPQVARTVRSAAVQFDLRYTEFRDDPSPSFTATMTLFYEAVMVVAAHGAGLSNILFCRRGVYVVEVVPNSFITPFCFMQLAHGLGHHWHGIAVRRLGAKIVTVDTDQLSHVVHEYLQLWKSNTSNS